MVIAKVNCAVLGAIHHIPNDAGDEVFAPEYFITNLSQMIRFVVIYGYENRPVFPQKP